MSTVKVRFRQACGNDRAGEVKPIDATRAKRLLRTGYVELVAGEREQATASADEQAARPPTPAPRPRGERRG